MEISPPQKLSGIARLIGARIEGNHEAVVTGINEIHRVKAGDISFVDHPKYYDRALASASTVIIINKSAECPPGKALLVCDDPFNAYNTIVRHYAPFTPSSKAVSDSARIGKGTVIMPSVCIGNNVVIGSNCLIHPNVTIYDNSIIGNNVIVHANTVIGSDAFYYKRRDDRHDKMLSCGNVVIGSDVEIGAGSTIDRGVTHETVIGDGTKIDNHVHIGHDSVIGKRCLFAAQVGIAGMVTIEDGVILWGQVGVPSNVVIGKGAVVLAQSGITKSLEGGVTYFGSPAEEARKKLKELALIRKIPEVIRRLDG